MSRRGEENQRQGGKLIKDHRTIYIPEMKLLNRQKSSNGGKGKRKTDWRLRRGVYEMIK